MLFSIKSEGTLIQQGDRRRLVFYDLVWKSQTISPATSASSLWPALFTCVYWWGWGGYTRITGASLGTGHHTPLCLVMLPWARLTLGGAGKACFLWPLCDLETGLLPRASPRDVLLAGCLLCFQAFEKSSHGWTTALHLPGPRAWRSRQGWQGSGPIPCFSNKELSRFTGLS